MANPFLNQPMQTPAVMPQRQAIPGPVAMPTQPPPIQDVIPTPQPQPAAHPYAAAMQNWIAQHGSRQGFFPSRGIQPPDFARFIGGLYRR